MIANSVRDRKSLFSLFSSAQAVNEPTLPTNSSWKANATTVATNATIGAYPQAMFVNRNNTVAVAKLYAPRVMIWQNGSTSSLATLNISKAFPFSLFITIDNYLFIYNDQPSPKIDRWSMTNSTYISSLSIASACYGLFIDVYNQVYCSQRDLHQVVTYTLTNSSYSLTHVVGTGYNGSFSFRLNQPHGIYVTVQRSLIVADCGNNRIQSFAYGRKNGITLAGNGANSSLTLNCPSSVTLDANGTLYIADMFNYRIVSAWATGFRCIVGCTQIPGPAPNQLNNPRALSFDSIGNLFVLDLGNSRLQMFDLLSENQGKRRTGERIQLRSATLLRSNFYL